MPRSANVSCVMLVMLLVVATIAAACCGGRFDSLTPSALRAPTKTNKTRTSRATSPPMGGTVAGFSASPGLWGLSDRHRCGDAHQIRQQVEPPVEAEDLADAVAAHDGGVDGIAGGEPRMCMGEGLGGDPVLVAGG